MISRNASIVIGVVFFVVFAGIAYETLQSASSTSLSVSSTSTAMNVTYNGPKFYEISNETKNISLNFTINSVATTAYIYDVAPLNNTTSTWQNITYINTPGNYLQYSLTNGTNIIHLTLTVNESVVNQMSIYNGRTGNIYVDKIIILSSSLGGGGFGFALVRIP
ncbi:MAG: hypothetical protein M1402_03320 [Candidatus Thermoplasmatota archaeon]|nr:hypothetical protein [Candidatus Thermoplasmatota archaeon]MCL5665988.1 hypothetical protein [Candidatus Thermoplasmatota archaeon]